MTTKLVNGVRIDITGTQEEADRLAESAANEPDVGSQWLADQQAELDRLIAQAKNVMADANATLGRLEVVLRAVVLIMKDRVNVLDSQWDKFKVLTAAATSLADFKTRVADNAQLPMLPQFTNADVKAAIRNKIDGGEATS